MGFFRSYSEDRLFLDQRENRHILESLSVNKRVLNTFCYSGGFSVYALRGGASLVHSVDSSSKAIHLTNQNIELNCFDTHGIPVIRLIF